MEQKWRYVKGNCYRHIMPHFIICEGHQSCQVPVPNSPLGKWIFIKAVILQQGFSIFPTRWHFTTYYQILLTSYSYFPLQLVHNPRVPLLYLLTFPPSIPNLYVHFIWLLFLYFYVQSISCLIPNKMLTGNRCPLVGWTISAYEMQS
jgi:hypothetical protein